MSHERKASATQQRGQIDQGLTGDKTPGFDPAAVPMETDAEAGGTATEHSEMLVARAAPQPKPNMNATSHGTAMRPFEDQRKKSAVLVVWPWLLGVALAVAIVVVGALLLR